MFIQCLGFACQMIKMFRPRRGRKPANRVQPAVNLFFRDKAGEIVPRSDSFTVLSFCLIKSER
jgi:hypothetical protein